jgi:hypothetical protein
LGFFDQNNGFKQLDYVLENNLIIFTETVEVGEEHHFVYSGRA